MRNPVTTYNYDAFGNQENATETDKNPFRYNGQYTDDETGLTYLRNRYYDSSTRAFVSRDPYWNPSNMIYGDNNTGVPDMNAIMQSANLYAYCGGNPVNRIDVGGLEYEYIRDLANSLVETGTIYSGDASYTPTDGNSIKIKVGEGYYYVRGEFYYNGDAEIYKNGGRSTKKEHIAENRDGKLYMERTDFYRAMNINYTTGTQKFTVTELENGLERLVATAVTGAITASFNPVVGGVIGFVSGEIVGNFQFEPGEYEAEYILGEVYNQATNRYEYIFTTTYYKMEIDDKGNAVKTFYSSISKYNLSSEESLL